MLEPLQQQPCRQTRAGRACSGIRMYWCCLLHLHRSVALAGHQPLHAPCAQQVHPSAAAFPAYSDTTSLAAPGQRGPAPAAAALGAGGPLSGAARTPGAAQLGPGAKHPDEGMLQAMAGVLQEVSIAGPAAGISLGGFVSGVAALAAAHPGIQPGQSPQAAAAPPLPRQTARAAAAEALRSAVMQQAAGLIRGLHDELEQSKEQVGQVGLWQGCATQIAMAGVVCGPTHCVPTNGALKRCFGGQQQDLTNFSPLLCRAGCEAGRRAGNVAAARVGSLGRLPACTAGRAGSSHRGESPGGRCPQEGRCRAGGCSACSSRAGRVTAQADAAGAAWWAVTNAAH